DEKDVRAVSHAGPARSAPGRGRCALASRLAPNRATGGARLRPESERDALLWIESVSEFDAPW
ncbi:MAG: hypothetical protein ACRD3W_28890, partial [Terriglobales bacterium]